ncbi:MAG: hypothetical protein IV088_15200 [Hydrogenophaga sp.]|nr:hypothetical protein [Hydrogenophaga sp.]MBT9552194.1 hypothetical protein [Hydrogenophaga sp.]
MIDHVFIFIERDGPEIDALKRLGLTETHRRAHPGQGTANVPRRGLRPASQGQRSAQRRRGL